jgi:glucuronoarabinoxylan endo-1,4-beta-xylanase
MKIKNHLIVLILATIHFACNESHQTSETIDISIDLEETHQTIEGFGTCLVTYRDYPPEYHDPEFLDLVVNDLGISILRVPVMEHTEYQNDDGDPDHFNWQGFYMQNNNRRKGMDEELKLYQEFKKRGVDRFMATPWSPPQYMKTNRAPIKGGHLRADMTDEFAEFLSAYIILAKKNYDIDINWMSIQNELLFAQFFRSCVYQPYILRETVRSVNRKFKKEGINTKILIPEDMMFLHRMKAYIEPTMADPETKNFNGHFSTHRKAEKEELRQWVEETKQYQRQNWMTETSGHNANWQGALKMASDIQDYLVNGNFSAWVYWQLSGGSGNNIEQEGKYNLLVAGKPTPKYYAAKHFYRFVRPGALRLEATPVSDSLLVAAFKHEVDGNLTINVINQKNEDIFVNLSFEGEFIPKKFTVYSSSERNNWEKQSAIKRGDKLMIPARGIITAHGFNNKLKTKNTVSLPEAWQVPKVSENEIWGNDEPLNIEKEWQREADGNASLLSEAENAVTNQALSKTRFNGWTILHDAILQGDGDAVQFLIENGADVDARANDGWTPLHVAASIFAGNERMNDNNREYSKYDIFKLVLEAKPAVNVKTVDEWTPLHSAVANAYTGWRQNEKMDLKRIEDLINAGAEINTKDINGRTPLHWNAWQGYAQQSGTQDIKGSVTRLLLKFGAEVNVQDKFGKTPLHYAAQMGYNEIVFELVNAGTNIDITDAQNNTAMDLAKQRNLEEIVYIINNKKLPENASINKTSDKDIKGKLGQELVEAAWNGDLEKVKELLDKEADVNYVDMDGFKAIDRARDNGHDKIVELLEAQEEK